MATTDDDTNRRYAALFQGADLTAMEQKLAQQNALVNMLRQQAAGGGGRDWGSQLSRAVAGGAGAYGYMKGQKDYDALGAARTASAQDKADFIMKRGKYAPQMPVPDAPRPAPTLAPQMPGMPAPYDPNELNKLPPQGL